MTAKKPILLMVLKVLFCELNVIFINRTNIFANHSSGFIQPTTCGNRQQCIFYEGRHTFHRFYQVPSLQDLFKTFKPEVILEFLKVAAVQTFMSCLNV